MGSVPSRTAPFGHRTVGLAFRATSAALRILPGPAAYALADAAVLPLAAWSLLHERRVARSGRGLFRNQQIAFRGLDRRRARRLFLAWARHVSHLAVDFCRMPRIRADNVRAHVDLRDVDEILRPLFDEGRGVLCVSGHMGAWELSGHALSLLGLPVSIVTRPVGAAPVDAAVNAIRRSGGQRVLAKRGALWPALKTLERGEIAGFLADENARGRPIFAPFLGTDAATTPAPAFLHRKTGAPIAVVSCHRIGRERFRWHVWRVIRHAPTADERADLEAITAELNASLTDALLAYPAQWHWGSRRFLTRPPGERPGDDGLPPPAWALGTHP